jgi:heme/copper-type cytochrome/quinol oxidase subunit 2
MIVHVTGEQFAWTSTTPGPDGNFGRRDLKLLDLHRNPLGLDRSDPAAMDDVTTVNQLYLPVNMPIYRIEAMPRTSSTASRARVPSEA